MGDFYIIPGIKPGKIESPSDIGLDLIVEKMAEFIGKDRVPPKLSEEELERLTSYERNKYKSEKKWVDPDSGAITEVLGFWLYDFETDSSAILDRQQIVGQALENSQFTRAIDSSSISSFDFRKDMYSQDRDSRTSKLNSYGYGNALKRIESYAVAVSAIKDSLNKNPGFPFVARLFDYLSAKEREVEELKEKLKTDLEPSAKIKVNLADLMKYYRKNKKLEGDRHKNYIRNIDQNEVLSARNEVSCKVINKITGEEYEYKMDFSDRCSFLENIVKQFYGELKKKPLIEALKLRFLSKIRLEAELNYDSSEKGVLRGKVNYFRNNETTHGTYESGIGFSRTSLSSFIEQRMLEQNFPLLKDFDEKIVKFEGMLGGMKAISAAAHYMNAIKEKGYPLAFPKPVQGDSADIKIIDMYNPLYTLLLESRVIPNNVETTPDRNVLIITGANENGKSTYMNGVGQSYALFQAGLPIVAREAEMAIKDHILVHRVNPGDIGSTSSRHAFECELVDKTSKRMTYKTLLLCDELFTGTAPSDGIACSTHFIDYVVQTGGTGLFVSHFMPLAQGYEKCPNVALMCFKLDHTTEPPFTFRMEPGVAESSEGEAIAARHGVSAKHFNFTLGQKEFNQEIKKRPLIK